MPKPARTTCSKCDVPLTPENRVWGHCRICERERCREKYLTGPKFGAGWDRKNTNCTDCGQTLTLENREQTKPTIDHIVPLSLGGTHDPSNVVPACLTCNIQKGIKLWRPFRPKSGEQY